MSHERFLYVTYIRTTPDEIWEALTEPRFTRSYWFGCFQESDWTVGGEWKLMFPDGRIGDRGSIVEVDRPRRLVISWRNEFMPELHAEGFSRCTFELEPIEDMVKLVVTHEIDREGSKLIEAVSGGWPKILSSLKSLIETGQPLAETTRFPVKAKA